MFAVFQDDGVIVMFHISKSTQEYVMTPRSSPPTKSHLGWWLCLRARGADARKDKDEASMG